MCIRSVSPGCRTPRGAPKEEELFQMRRRPGRREYRKERGGRAAAEPPLIAPAAKNGH